MSWKIDAKNSPFLRSTPLWFSTSLSECIQSSSISPPSFSSDALSLQSPWSLLTSTAVSETFLLLHSKVPGPGRFSQSINSSILCWTMSHRCFRGHDPSEGRTASIDGLNRIESPKVRLTWDHSDRRKRQSEWNSCWNGNNWTLNKSEGCSLRMEYKKGCDLEEMIADRWATYTCCNGIQLVLNYRGIKVFTVAGWIWNRVKEVAHDYHARIGVHHMQCNVNFQLFTYSQVKEVSCISQQRLLTMPIVWCMLVTQLQSM